jgi:hypothetical protein
LARRKLRRDFVERKREMRMKSSLGRSSSCAAVGRGGIHGGSMDDIVEGIWIKMVCFPIRDEMCF